MNEQQALTEVSARYWLMTLPDDWLEDRDVWGDLDEPVEPTWTGRFLTALTWIRALAASAWVTRGRA
jgi:hypothetical protein